MNIGRGMFSRWRIVPLLLLAVLVGGCGDGPDESAPALTFAGTTPLTTVRSRSLAGTVEPGATLTVTVDTAAEVNGLVVADGLWSCTVAALAPGANLVTLQAADAAGNRTVLSLTLLYEPLTIERWVTPLREDTLTIGGLVDPAAAEGGLSIAVDTGASPGVPDVTGDHWKAVLSGLIEGDNVITVTFTPADLEEVTQTLTVTVNPDAPVVTIHPVKSPTNVGIQGITGERSGNLNVTPSAPTATVENLKLDGDPAEWGMTLTGLTRGKNPFTVSVTVENGITATARDLIVFDPTAAPAQ